MQRRCQQRLAPKLTRRHPTKAVSLRRVQEGIPLRCEAITQPSAAQGTDRASRKKTSLRDCRSGRCRRTNQLGHQIFKENVRPGSTIGSVIVEVWEEPTCHVVRVKKLLSWLKAPGKFPPEEQRKAKLRQLVK